MARKVGRHGTVVVMVALILLLVACQSPTGGGGGGGGGGGSDTDSGTGETAGGDSPDDTAGAPAGGGGGSDADSGTGEAAGGDTSDDSAGDTGGDTGGEATGGGSDADSGAGEAAGGDTGGDTSGDSSDGSPGEPADDGTADDASSYTLAYDGNGAEGGSPPADSTEYQAGDTATVLGNSGGLTKADHTFSDWNTNADGSGTTFVEGAQLTMPERGVTLYAFWLPKGSVSVSFENPEDPSITFGGATDEVVKGNALSVNAQGSYSGHSWYLNGSSDHAALTTDDAEATIDTGELGYGTHSISLFVSEGYSAGFSFAVVDSVTE